MNTSPEVDAYIATFPAATQVVLRKLREILRRTLPEATERMSYGIPTYSQKRNLIHFGGYAHHVGIYPGTQVIADFSDKLTEYKTSKGAVQLPLDKPIPYDLVEAMAQSSLAINGKS